MFTSFVFVALVFMSGFGNQNLFSQSEGQRLAIGFNAGGNKYWGEFTDNQFWLYGDAFVRYNIFSYLSVNGSFYLGQTRFKTDKAAVDKYTDYFNNTEISPITKNYYDLRDPITNILKNIRDKNSIRWNAYDLTLSLNLFPNERFVPYFFGGVGWFDWDTKIGDTGYDGATPNNSLGTVYEKSKLSFPVGFAYEIYLTDNLAFNGKVTYRFMGTDYFDDLSDANYPTTVNGKKGDDELLTFGMGFSYYILGDADYDKDGLTNSREKEIGTDPRNPDTDGDGLKDGEEVKTYYTNPLLQDTDADGLTDYDEVFKYQTSPVKPDSDSDGLNDGEEVARKTDPNNSDTDNDKLLDGDEVKKYETDPMNFDTDGDGLGDGQEVLTYATNPKAKDTDGDGLSDGDEINTYKTNPITVDSDGDGLNDGLEVLTHKTDPLKPDTDDDGLNDGAEINEFSTNPLIADTDGDGLNDGDEVRKHKTNPLLADSDKDGLKDGDEISKYKTNPVLADTDSDGLNDGAEVLTHKTDPLKADTDGDGINDGDEVSTYKTNPLKPDTDNDKLSDGKEIKETKTDPLNPDTDGDTIIDGEDDCPHTPGIASTEKGKNGCPLPPKIGTKTDFPDILFIVNTDNFNFEYPGTIQNLTKLLEYVKQCDNLQVRIEGHASEEGSKTRNQELSDMRAKKVRGWLIEQGVVPDKIQGAIGFGTKNPKIKEPTGKALKNISKEELENIRKQNRRITVEVVKTCD